MPLIPDESNPNAAAANSPGPSLQNSFASPPERLTSKSTPASAVHSRETSAVRGRAAPDHSTLNPSSLQHQNNRRGQSHSKSPETTRPAVGYDAGLERRPSNSSYGHHRQTSIVHGVQHSHNASFATSPASNSPLSPELIASLRRSGGTGAASGSGAPELESSVFTRLDQPEILPYQNPAANGSTATMDDLGSGSPAYHRRMNSNGRTWQDRSHSRSHSRQHTELKTVGEYALHHLFNSVWPLSYFPPLSSVCTEHTEYIKTLS